MQDFIEAATFLVMASISMAAIGAAFLIFVG